MLVDMIGKDVTGKDAEAALGKAHITVNKNAVPNDPQKPFVTSGLRLGTPAVTTRGYREADCVALANWICDVLDAPTTTRHRARARERDDAVPAVSGVRIRRTLHCPFCQHVDTRVIDSRVSEDGATIRRRRECEACGERFSTLETIELKLPMIIKGDGRREQFDARKLRLASIARCRSGRSPRNRSKRRCARSCTSCA